MKCNEKRRYETAERRTQPTLDNRNNINNPESVGPYKQT